MRTPWFKACLTVALFTGCTDNVPPHSKAAAPGAAAPVVRATPPPPSHAALPNAVPAVPSGEPVLVVPSTETPIALAHEQPCRLQHLRQAGVFEELGELREALDEVRRAAFDTPEEGPVLTEVARLARKSRHPKLAAQAYEALALLFPQDAAPLVQAARMHLARKDASSAQKAVREALRRDPGFVEAHHVAGRAALMQGALAEAIFSFEQAVQLAPDHAHALNNLGFAYLQANENDRALAVLQQAAQLLPTVAYVQNNLGVALERLGHADQAHEAFSLARELSPRYVKAILNSQRLEKLASARGSEPASPEAPELPLVTPDDVSTEPSP